MNDDISTEGKNEVIGQLEANFQELLNNPTTELMTTDPIGREMLTLQFLSAIMAIRGVDELLPEEEIRWRNLLENEDSTELFDELDRL